MTLTVDIKKNYALSVLEGLEKIGAINITESVDASVAKRKKTYDAIKISLRGYRFNREDANER